MLCFILLDRQFLIFGNYETPGTFMHIHTFIRKTVNLKELKVALENLFKKSEKKCKKFKKFKKKFKLLKRKLKKIEYNFFNIGFITKNNNTNVSSDEHQNEILDEDNYMNFIVIGGTFYVSGFFSW